MILFPHEDNTTVFRVSFTCDRGLISPLALLGFATSHQHRIVSVMSQWWVWANVQVADNVFVRYSEGKLAKHVNISEVHGRFKSRHQFLSIAMWYQELCHDNDVSLGRLTSPFFVICIPMMLMKIPFWTLLNPFVLIKKRILVGYILSCIPKSVKSLLLYIVVDYITTSLWTHHIHGIFVFRWASEQMWGALVKLCPEATASNCTSRDVEVSQNRGASKSSMWVGLSNSHPALGVPPS